MSRQKKKRKALRIAGGVCGVLLVAALAVEFRYLPRYLADRETFDVAQAPCGDPAQIRVMSANVRCFSPTDLGKKSWFYRAALLRRSVADSRPDVIGFQEVTPLHYRYLTRHLAGYGHAITYRDRSPLSEGCPIFYDASRFEAVREGAFWLSETPDECSKYPGAAFPRICCYAVLRQRADGTSFIVCNTHLDHVSEQARIDGMRLILEKVRELGDLPCVLMGDLNAVEDSETYRAAVSLFDDAKYRTDDPPRGPTYQNWGQKPDAENIDYFFVSKTGIAVTDYAIADTLYDGVYPSDHFPILLDIAVGG